MATFIGPPGTDDAGDFSAALTLPDGSQVAGTVTAGPVNDEFDVNCPSVTLSGEYGFVEAAVSGYGEQLAFTSTTLLNPEYPQFAVDDLDGGHADAVEGEAFSMDVASFRASGPMPASLSVYVNLGEDSWPAQIESAGGSSCVVVASVPGDMPVGDDQVVLVLIESNDSELPGSLEAYATVSVTDKALAVTQVAGVQAVEDTDLSYPSASTALATFTAQTPDECQDFWPRSPGSRPMERRTCKRRDCL